MIVSAAKNQWLMRVGVGSVAIVTDPIPLGAWNRAAAVLLVHSITGGTTTSDRHLSYFTEVSNDSVTWVNQGPSDVVTESSDTPAQSVADVNGVAVRFRFIYDITAGAGAGDVCFDLAVRLDTK